MLVVAPCPAVSDASSRRAGIHEIEPNAEKRCDLIQLIEGVPQGISRVLEDSRVGVKHFVLDTNVLLHNPNAIFLLADNEIIIPFDVIEELDKFKIANDDLGRNARTVIRHLDRLREAGRLADGVPVKETGGLVRVVLPLDQPLSPGINANTPDNRIISVAFALHKEGKRVVFI